MNFTREPLIETVITPKEGYKLVVRSSKGVSQEEFFVDAIEVISFGKASFYRSVEKPKCFVVPVNDYEILEVRESRMVLKSGGVEKGGIKIGGGRETSLKPPKEDNAVQEEIETTDVVEQRIDKRRDRRRSRKKRGKGEQEEGVEVMTEVPLPQETLQEKKGEKPSLIPPPSTLISETISRYKTHPVSEEMHLDVQEVKLLSPPPLLVQRNDDNLEDEEMKGFDFD